LGSPPVGPDAIRHTVTIPRRAITEGGMTVHKEVTVTATSPDSWEDAAMNAVDRTDATVENLQWAVVQDQSIQLQDTTEPQFRTKVKIGFEVQE
jgi:flavin-binding protein dodecin